MSESYAVALLNAMQGRPVVLVAAGVALLNQANELLLLERPEGQWDLPGGHLEPGDSFEQTARRELEEETGFKAHALDLLGVISGAAVYHRGRNAYYVTALYRVCSFEGELRLSEEHIGSGFFALNALPEALSVAAQDVAARLGLASLGRRLG